MDVNRKAHLIKTTLYKENLEDYSDVPGTVPSNKLRPTVVNKLRNLPRKSMLMGEFLINKIDTPLNKLSIRQLTCIDHHLPPEDIEKIGIDIECFRLITEDLNLSKDSNVLEYIKLRSELKNRDTEPIELNDLEANADTVLLQKQIYHFDILKKNRKVLADMLEDYAPKVLLAFDKLYDRMEKTIKKPRSSILTLASQNTDGGEQVFLGDSIDAVINIVDELDTLTDPEIDNKSANIRYIKPLINALKQVVESLKNGVTKHTNFLNSLNMFQAPWRYFRRNWLRCLIKTLIFCASSIGTYFGAKNTVEGIIDKDNPNRTSLIITQCAITLICGFITLFLGFAKDPEEGAILDKAATRAENVLKILDRRNAALDI